jgi:hypothetical protein
VSTRAFTGPKLLLTPVIVSGRAGPEVAAGTGPDAAGPLTRPA